MKNQQVWKPVVVLTGICLFVSLLLAGVNLLTAPVIEGAEAEAAAAACREVMPDGEDFEKLALPDGAPSSVTGLWRETSGKGYTVKLVTNGFSSGYQIMCGISSEGKITGTRVLSHNETEGYGSRTTEKDFSDRFLGLSMGDVDGNRDLLLSGATRSSTAYRAAVCDAFRAVALISGEGETK